MMCVVKKRRVRRFAGSYCEVGMDEESDSDISLSSTAEYCPPPDTDSSSSDSDAPLVDVTNKGGWMEMYLKRT